MTAGLRCATSGNDLAMLTQYLTRRQALATLATTSLLAATGCGTILYPERRGQPKGKLDWGVVALDGVGLLLFFIPGVIAFAVDFATGAIYLPPDCGQSTVSQENSPGNEFTIVHTKPTRQHIEQTLAEHTGQTIHLNDERLTTRPLQKLRDFWPTLRSLS